MCSVEFVGVDGLVIGVHCGIIGMSGLVMGAYYGIYGLVIQPGGVWWLVAVWLLGMMTCLAVFGLGMQLGVVGLVLISHGL